MRSFPYTATLISSLFTVCMGGLYIASFHVEGAPDDTIRQGFIAGVTLTTGSIAIERAMIVRNGNGKGSNGDKKE